MSDKVIIKTNLENPPPELMYCWREPYEVFPVKDNGTVEGLSMDHPRWLVLKNEWKLEVIEAGVSGDKIVKPPDVAEEVA